MAGRILDQALCFLKTCSENPDLYLSPSKQVDIGWDVFLTYTYEYQQWCTEHAGRPLHHTPLDDPSDEIVTAGLVLTPQATADVMRQSGFLVDDELWPADDDATPCYNGRHERKGGDGGQ